MKILENWAYTKTAKQIQKIVKQAGYLPLGLAVNSWCYYWLERRFLRNTLGCPNIFKYKKDITSKIEILDVPIFKI